MHIMQRLTLSDHLKIIIEIKKTGAFSGHPLKDGRVDMQCVLLTVTKKEDCDFSSDHCDGSPGNRL